MDAHVLMYYIALTLGHMRVSGGFIYHYQTLHTIFTILRLLHKYQLLPCTLISRSPATCTRNWQSMQQKAEGSLGMTLPSDTYTHILSARVISGVSTELYIPNILMVTLSVAVKLKFKIQD